MTTSRGTHDTVREHQDRCPNVANHTYGPTGYIQWHHWATGMRQTHTQARCPGCGFFLIVRPKTVRSEAR